MKQEAASGDARSASLQNCKEGLSGIYKPSGPLPSAVLPEGSQAETLHPSSCRKHPSSCRKHPRALGEAAAPRLASTTLAPEGLGASSLHAHWPMFWPVWGEKLAHPARSSLGTERDNTHGRYTCG